MNLTNRLVTATIWEFGSTIIQAVLQFSILAILARLIPPDGFGLYGITSMAVSIIFLFSELGTRQAVVRRQELNSQFISSAFVLSIALGMLGNAILWGSSPFVADFFHKPEATNLLRVASLTLTINGYATVANALLEKKLEFRKLAIINVTSYFTGFGIIGSSLALLGLGAWAIVLASVSQSITRAIMLLAVTKQTPLQKGISTSDFQDLVHFGTGLTIANSFGNLAYYVDNVIVGRLLGPFALGLYQMAFQIMDLPRRFLGNIIDRVVFAALANVLDDQKRMRIGYFSALEIANVILVPVTVLFIVVIPEAVSIIMGDKWDGLVLPLQILLTQVPLRASLRMADNIGTAVGKVYKMASLKFLYATMVCIAALIGVRTGLIGVAICVTIAVVINWAMMVWFTLYIIKASIRAYIKTWIPAFLTGSIILCISETLIETLRGNVPSEFIRLCMTITITILTVMLAVWIQPRLLGDVALNLIVDFGTRLPIISKAIVHLCERAHIQSKSIAKSTHFSH